MADANIGTLKGVLELEDRWTEKIREAIVKVHEFSQSWGPLGQTAVGILGGLTAAVVGTTAAIAALATKGSEIADMEGSFNALSRGAKSTSDVMLGALRQGVVGTVGDLQLMEVGVKVLGGGMIRSSEDMKTFALGARGMSETLGVTTAEAFQILTKAMATGRTQMLAQKGLFVDTQGAIKEYAAAHGLAANEMTKSDRIAAGQAAILATLRERFKDPAPLDFADMIRKGVVSIENFKDAIASSVAQSPVLGIALNAISNGLATAFGGDRQTMVRSIVGYVNEFIIMLARAGNASISVAQFVVNTWNGIKIGVTYVLEVISQAVSGVVSVLSRVVEFAAKVPGAIGESARAMLPDIQMASGYLKALTVEYGKQREEAITSAGAQTAAFAKGHAVMGDLLKQMEAVRGASIKVEDAQVRVGHASVGASASAVKAKESEAKAIERQYSAMQSRLNLIGKSGEAKRVQEAKNAYEKEVALINGYATITAQKRTEMLDMAKRQYEGEVEAAGAGATLITKTRQKLAEAIKKSSTDGLTGKLADLSVEEQATIRSLDLLQATNKTAYTNLTREVSESYDAQKQAAIDAALAKDQTTERTEHYSVDEARKRLAHMKDVERQVLAAAVSTDQQRAQSAARVAAAQKDLDLAERDRKVEMYSQLASTFSSALTSIFGKSKAAAYAGAIIDAAVAQMKVWTGPGTFYEHLVQAIVVGVASAVQIAKISSASFAAGTPGLDYSNFGSQTPAMLHGEEAVIPRAKAGSFADDVAARLGMGAGVGKELHVHLKMNGREVTKQVVRLMPHELSLAGVR